MNSSECEQIADEIRPLLGQLMNLYEAISSLVNKVPRLQDKLYRMKKNRAKDIPKLTEREVQIAKAFVEYGRVKVIAANMHISPHTVKSHIRVLKKKMGVRTAHALLKRLLTEQDQILSN